MDAVLRNEAQLLAHDLYAVIQDLAPSKRDDHGNRKVAAGLRTVDSRLKALRAVEQKGGDPGELAALDKHLSAVDKLLVDAVIDEHEEVPESRWKQLRRRASPVYEAFASWLREQEIVVPSLRPANWKRVVFHVASGLFAFTLIQVCSPFQLRLVAFLFAAYCWGMEWWRRRNPDFNERLMEMYGPLAHPHETHRVNSGTWYATALLIISFLAEPMVCSLAVVVLAFADPAAGIVGRRWGRTPLRAGRSLEGTLAFTVAGFVTSAITLLVFHPGTPGAHVAGLALTAGVFGALAELWTKHFDDNFMIPLAVAAFTSLYVTLFM